MQSLRLDIPHTDALFCLPFPNCNSSPTLFKASRPERLEAEGGGPDLPGLPHEEVRRFPPRAPRDGERAAAAAAAA